MWGKKRGVHHHHHTNDDEKLWFFAWFFSFFSLNCSLYGSFDDDHFYLWWWFSFFGYLYLIRNSQATTTKKMKKRWRIVSVDRPCQTALRRILPEGLPVQDNNSNNNKKMPRTTAYIGNTHTQVCRHSPCHCKTLAVFWPFYVFWSFDHQTDLFFFLCYLTCFF